MFEQKLYVRGPSNTTPRLLLTETSSHFVKFWLGPNGILAAQPTGKAPCLFFPEREEPVIVQMPQPATTNRYGTSHLPLLFDRCWFSGGALLFESHISGPDYLLGLFLLDAEKKTISTGRICLEINDADYHLAECARVSGDKILFAGKHVFWRNKGWPWRYSRQLGKPVPNTWETPEIRAFDIDRKEILSGNEIPRALIAEHKEALEKVFGHALD